MPKHGTTGRAPHSGIPTSYFESNEAAVMYEIANLTPQPDVLRSFAQRHFNGSTPLQLLASELMVEAAMRELDADQASADFETAENFLERCKSREQQRTGNIMTSISLRAGVSRAYLPAFRAERFEGILPDERLQGEVYSSLLEALFTDHLPEAQDDDLVGAMGEAAILALLLRYAASNHPDGSWHPRPSLVSQDRSHLDRRTLVNGNWDISVLTRLEANDPPEESYKIQVKMSRRLSEDIFADEISVLHVTEDLLNRSSPRHRYTVHDLWPMLYDDFYLSDTVDGRVASQGLLKIQDRLIEWLD